MVCLQIKSHHGFRLKFCTGNGIQHAFYQDPNVLYISIHVYEDGTFYPSLVDGNHLHCGEGLGLGK